MSRERKENIHCTYCGRNGLKYLTEEFHNGSWDYVSSAVSDGWGCYKCGLYLCPKCVDDPRAHRKIHIKIKSIRKRQFLGFLIMLIALSISAFIFYFMGPLDNDIALWKALKYAAIPFFLALPVCCFFIKGFKEGLGCFVVLIIAIAAYVYLGDDNNTHVTANHSESNEVSQKRPAYLSDTDNISTNDELGDFYFSIATKFYYNEMGLKGSQEQIEAGNKLMVRVYDFLGKSAKHEMLNIDSMKIFVKNFADVSDFRKKMAFKDLQIGIDKIESLNE